VLLDRSGFEPPDTLLLTWGPIMGLVEASAREQVATALECAVGRAICRLSGRVSILAPIAELIAQPPFAIALGPRTDPY
jgi:hypothetical protein